MTESIRLKPFQVILFDEVEKAHLDILNLMLQLLDEGRLTDSKGVTVDFRNTIIILTSNVGANLPSYQRVAKLTEYFRPEFLNRLDDIVSFHQLKPDHLRKIVEIHLGKLLKRAAAIGYQVTVDEKAKDWFVDEVFASKFGVRALKRLIQDQVENPLSLLIMQEKIHPGIPVFLNVDPSGRKLQVYAKRGEAKIEPPPPAQEKEIIEEIAEEKEEEFVPSPRPEEEAPAENVPESAPETETQNASESDETTA